jgi:uncharacterized caspase-like protein
MWGKAVIKGFLLVICFGVFLSCATTAKSNASGARYALIIGNADYQSIGKLRNAVNDAQDISDALKQSGYQVELGLNLQYAEMERVIDNYIEKLSQSANAEGLFYFAGQSIAVDDDNYLLPVDITIDRTKHTVSDAYMLEKFLERLNSAGTKVNVVIMDACSGSPSSTQKGLDINDQTLDRLQSLDQFTKDIFYLQSASPGQIASDGAAGSRNSPFTRALLGSLSKSEAWDTLVQEIIAQTLEYTKGAQKPWYRAKTEDKGYVIYR